MRAILRVAFFCCLFDLLFYLWAQEDIQQLSFANSLFERKLYKMAIKEYLIFLEKYPTSKYTEEAIFQLILCYWFTENYSKGLSYCNLYLQKYPKGNFISNVYFYRGKMLYFQHKYNLAIVNFQKGSSINKEKKSLFYYWIALSYEKLNKFKIALDFLDKINLSSTEDIYQLKEWLRLRLLYQQKRFKEVIKLFDKISKNISDKKIFQECLLLKGMALQQEGKFYSALELFNTLFDSAYSINLKDKSFYYMGVSLFYLGKISQLQKVISSYSPKTEWVKIGKLFLKGCISYTKNKNEEAIFIFNKVLSIDHEGKFKVDTLLYILKSYFRLKNLKGISGTLSLLTNIPLPLDKEIEVKYIEIEYLFLIKDYQKCVLKAIQYLSKYPSSQFIPEVLYKKGICYYKLSQYLKGIKTFENLLKFSNYKKIGVLNIIEGYIHLKRYSDAISYYRLYFKLLNNFRIPSEIYYNYGLCLYMNKNYEEAINIWKKVKGKLKDEALYYTAICYQKLGKTSLAIHTYKHLRKGFPTSPYYNISLYNEASLIIKENPSRALQLFIQVLKNSGKDLLDESLLLWIIKESIKEKKLDEAWFVCKFIKDKFNSLYFKGKVLRLKGQYEEAIKFLLESLKIAQNNYPLSEKAKQEIAITYFEMRIYDKATQYAKELISSSNSLVRVQGFLLLGKIAYMKKDYEQGLRELMRVYLLYNEPLIQTEALLWIVKCFIKKKEFNNAKKFLKEFNQYFKNSAIKDKYFSTVKKLEEKVNSFLIEEKHP